MNRSEAKYHHRSQQHHQNHPRLQAAAGRWATDYTLLHAGRQLRIGPIAFWIAVGTLSIMAVWTLSTATYFAFREDVLTRLIARQAEMQFGYEDRIADLRAQVDRMSSRQLLDQEQYEQKLAELIRRQAMLEARTNALGGLPDSSATGSIRQPARGEPRSSPLKPAPINERSLLAPNPLRGAYLDPRAERAALAALSSRTGGMQGVLGRVMASLDRVESRQGAALSAMEERFDARARRIRLVLAEVGVDPSKTTPGAGMGGPFVPARPPHDADTFERQVYRVKIARAQNERLTRTLAMVPLRRPVTGEIDMTSAYGVRIDPFNRSPAMHTGIDFRGETGEPIHATAAGTVTVAGWQGGYGRMVEVDHGNGLATRYGHLSAIDVHVGQTVKLGQVIGRLGSTGRSTGPHLHYETRIAGDAVDPQKFLKAGAKLGGDL